jgi:thioredoxin-like negative regulator of GroEL
MKRHRIFLLLACLIASDVVRAELPAGWNTNGTAILASERREPVLVYFTASWCVPCKLMSRLILGDPLVEAALTNMDHVAIDIEENGKLAAKFGVSAVPTFVFLSAEGEEVDRFTGFRPADEFLQWLTNGVSKVKEDALQRQLLKTKLANADLLLAATNSPTPELAADLFDLCAARDQAFVQSGAQRLQTLAARNPALVLAGLTDTRLAVRIQAANAMRAQLGETFDIDPWDNAITREKACAHWRHRLTSSAKAPE